MIHWLLHSDAGLLTRIVIGCAVFTCLAIVDYRRNGSRATRWREYSVLLAAVVAALLYGAVNDQVTCTISPEYFLYGKELYKTIGDDPSKPVLHWEAAKVGFKATWSVGLIFGVALLLANNPSRRMPRLRYRSLIPMIRIILITTAMSGILGGWLGYHGHLARFSSDFQDMIDADVYRPRRFMCTWGIHLGDYIGGVVGTVIAVAMVIDRRKRISTNSAPT